MWSVSCEHIGSGQHWSHMKKILFGKIKKLLRLKRNKPYPGLVLQLKMIIAREAAFIYPFSSCKVKHTTNLSCRMVSHPATAVMSNNS